FTQYLTLVGLAALLVGGIGIANSTTYFLDRKREVIATMKSLGTRRHMAYAIYLTQVLFLALIGVVIGLAIGAALPFAVEAAFGTIVPLPLAGERHPPALVLGLAYGVLVAGVFSLWPLGRAHDVRASSLFRG